MPEPHQLPWNPLTPNEAASLFATWDQFWCVAGGWALDLWLGRATREHGDIDLQILRRDVEALPGHLAGWDLHIAAAGRNLPRWKPGDAFPPDAHNLWCRPAGTERWRLQILVMDHDADRWIFRRNRTIGGPLESLRVKAGGIPVIAPEVQLLFKSKGLRPKDEADFRVILPHLTDVQRAWLREALETHDPGHPWIASLAAISKVDNA